MTKAAAIDSFWNSFGIPAYEEHSVPDSAGYPRITYELQTGSFDEVIYLTASLYYRSDSWIPINGMTETISQRLTGGYNIKCDEGSIVIDKSSPFALSDGDEKDNMLRIKRLNITAEFNTLN